MTPVQIATTQPELEILHAVVHASHSFSEDFKRAKGLRTRAEELSVRGHGEWRECEPVAAEAGPDSTDEAAPSPPNPAHTHF